MVVRWLVLLPYNWEAVGSIELPIAIVQKRFN